MVHDGSIARYRGGAVLSGQGQVGTVDADSRSDAGTRRGAPTVDRERQLVADAVAVVAKGGARRVTVAGVRFGNLLLPTARRLGAERGVHVRPVPRADGSGSDLVVERRAVSRS